MLGPYIGSHPEKKIRHLVTRELANYIITYYFISRINFSIVLGSKLPVNTVVSARAKNMGKQITFGISVSLYTSVLVALGPEPAYALYTTPLGVPVRNCLSRKELHSHILIIMTVLCIAQKSKSRYTQS